eukprot:m.111287 g.111287  ORF g.111287 m.111287 type:complete len:87 (-) comp9367_c0_seq1:259-519(-)
MRSSQEEKEKQLCDAAMTGRHEEVKQLLQNGTIVNCADSTGLAPLQLAAGNGYPSTMALLIAHGANIHCKTDYGWTPLHFSICAAQ